MNDHSFPHIDANTSASYILWLQFDHKNANGIARISVEATFK